MDLVGRVMIAFHRAFEMGHERRTFDGQVVVVFHGLWSRLLEWNDDLILRSALLRASRRMAASPCVAHPSRRLLRKLLRMRCECVAPTWHDQVLHIQHAAI